MALKAPKTRNLDRAKAKFFIKTIQQLLAVRPAKTIVADGSELKHAGVLIPLLLEGDNLENFVDPPKQAGAHHKGQISFPGGAVDADDKTYEQTALRETYEEIGGDKRTD